MVYKAGSRWETEQPRQREQEHKEASLAQCCANHRACGGASPALPLNVRTVALENHDGNLLGRSLDAIFGAFKPILCVFFHKRATAQTSTISVVAVAPLILQVLNAA